MSDVLWVVVETRSFILIISRPCIFKRAIPLRMKQREKQAIVFGSSLCLCARVSACRAYVPVCYSFLFGAITPLKQVKTAENY